MREHDLPAHPLVERGFVSIGDWHSTRKLEEGMTPEQTRHGGLQRECGLHLESGQGDFQI
jgi:phosphoadenosine phosphosulfate reductase